MRLTTFIRVIYPAAKSYAHHAYMKMHLVTIRSWCVKHQRFQQFVQSFNHRSRKDSTHDTQNLIYTIFTLAM